MAKKGLDFGAFGNFVGQAEKAGEKAIDAGVRGSQKALGGLKGLRLKRQMIDYKSYYEWLLNRRDRIFNNPFNYDDCFDDSE